VFAVEGGMELKINKNEFEEINSSDDSNYGGACDGHLPIIGIVKSSYPSDLTVYSLKSESAIHVWRFGSPIIKF